MALLGLLRSTRYERAGFGLYGAAVVAARDPFLFQALAVPDTLDGRFETIGLHVFLLIRRVRGIAPQGAGLAQALFDAMFADMDTNLREIGVGDLSVGKKVKAMWEAFHGRAIAYGAALDAGDAAQLEAALARNIWRQDAPPGVAAAMARLAMAQSSHVAAQPDADLLAGQVTFLNPSTVPTAQEAAQ